MLRESFIGKRPTRFHVNPVVKSFIISETFLWSAWNFIMPIFAVFVANHIAGGSVEIAASSFSVYLVVRVLFELLSGHRLSKNRGSSYKYIIIGMLAVTLGYFGLALTHTRLQVFLFYSLIGAGLGYASPAKNTLFSTHLDKDKESEEWGMYDATIFMGMALSAALGGFIASKYGFSLLFVIAGVVNTLGMIPYIVFSQSKKEPSYLTVAEKYVAKTIREYEKQKNEQDGQAIDK